MTSRISFKRKLLYLALVLIALVVLAEVGFRLLAPTLGVPVGPMKMLRDYAILGHEPRYAPHPFMVYTLNPEKPGHNSLGFRGREFLVKKPPGALRVACLGSSTTYCSRVKDKETYPAFLEGLLAGQGNAKAEVMNFGVPGWNTAETMINYFLNVQDYDPDAVIICHAVNDFAARRSNYRSDYYHIRKSWQQEPAGFIRRLLLRSSDIYTYINYYLTMNNLGIEALVTRSDGPPSTRDLSPRTSVAFRRNIRTVSEHAKRNGALVVLVTMPYNTAQSKEWPERIEALTQHNRILREIAAELDVLLVDLEALWLADPARHEPLFYDLVHTIPEGNLLKAETIAKAMRAWEERGANAPPSRESD
jgi:lysophospholipase L1-like esterase